MALDWNSWRPHGVITDAFLETPYREAKMSVDSEGNEISPKEGATVYLFLSLFQLVLFPERHYLFSPQESPASKKGNEKACDLAVKYVDSNGQHRIFCFAEAKRAANKTYAKIRDLEKQALGYCADHLSANSDVNLIYACTLVGPALRCWSLQRGGDVLQPFWGDSQSSYAQYLDIGEDQNTDTILWAFNAMKSIPIDGLGPIGMQHSEIGRINQGISGSGATNSIETFMNADYNSMPNQVPAGGYFPESSTQPPLPDFAAAAADTASSVRRATPEEQSQLTQDNYVEVSVLKAGRTIADTTFQLKTMEVVMKKKGREFEQIICSTDAGDQYCWIYLGKVSHTCYWTWTLDVDKKGKYVE